MDLLSLGEWLAVCAVADDVVGGKALGLVQLGRLQHPQADVDDHIRRALDRDCHQSQAILGRNGWCWLVCVAHVLCAVVADQEGRDAQRTFFVFR
ncbi:hypothetical protein D3C85_1671890 [compost metagenome]